MINTKVLMTLSSVLMAFSGLALTFLPEEIIAYFFIGDNPELAILFQVLGSLYFSFAMLNWMARANLIGGIYSRPVSIANFTHFFVGGMALLKAAWHLNTNSLWIAGVIYLVLTILFGLVVFTHPAARAVKTAF